MLSKLLFKRLKDLGEKLDQNALTSLWKSVEQKEWDRIDKILSPIKGVGSVVLRNFYIMRGLEE